MRLEELTIIDELTGLPNRRASSRYIQTIKQLYDQFALVMIDLNDFTNINDTLGHMAGNIALNEVARRWSELVQKTDTKVNSFVARQGGDEFILIISNYDNEEELNKIKKELITIFKNKVSNVYDGYFGVDMMICKKDNLIYLNPCVEINMRMNMGIVSRIIYDKYVDENSKGMFTIENNCSDGLFVSNTDFFDNNDLLIENGKIVSGVIPLTHRNKNSTYCAYISVQRNK